ncbi:MAG: HlyD family efflux transporter periplasmic adaptor subunit [Armatimonadetes bacterium]|nr:HlyD family efflux transporter periplasmic adaptor subunit [Armatimonadota bacterium]
MKRIVPLLVAVVVIVVGAVVIRSIAHRESARDILGSGIIEADEVRVSPKMGGRLAEVLVREGDEAKAGQVIARLEHEDIDAERQRAQAAVDAAEAALRDLERGSRPEQIAAARAHVAEAAAARHGADEQSVLALVGLRKGTDLKQAVDEARARSRAADARVAQAKAQLDEARRGATPEEIETLKAALAQAEARVAGAQTAAKNAEEIYARQSAIEGPLIAATTEEAVAQASAGLARTEASRADQLAKADAATGQALDRAKTEQSIADAKLAGAGRGVKDAEEQVGLTRAQALQLRDGARSALEEALRARDAAKAKLDVMLAGTREERVRLAEAAVRAAESEADGAKDGLTNATTAYDDRLAARSQKDAAQTALERARAVEQAAQAELSLLLAGHTQEAIQVARGRAAEAQAALKAVEVRRGYCDIMAPTSGTVTELILDAGEVAGPGSAIVVLSDLRNLWLRAYVGFGTLGSIVKGQRLQVVTEAVPRRVFEGVVTRISKEAEFTPKDVQTPDQRMRQVYWIKVGLGDADGLLKPGMPADVKTPTR